MIKRTPGNRRPFKEKEFTNLVPKPINEIPNSPSTRRMGYVLV
jgi:hypothetical protein